VIFFFEIVEVVLVFYKTYHVDTLWIIRCFRLGEICTKCFGPSCKVCLKTNFKVNEAYIHISVA
jgi:hypothetical protein